MFLSNTSWKASVITLVLILSLTQWVKAQNNKNELDSLKKIAQNQNSIESVKAYNSMARILGTNDPNLATQYAIKALELSIKLNYDEGVAASFNNVGVFYKNQGMYANALNYYNKALSIYRESNDEKGEAFSLSNIGTIYTISGNFEKALENYLQAYRLLKSLNLRKEMVGVLNNLGNIYEERNEDFRAIKIYEEAIKVAGPDTTELSADPLINIGNVYFNRNDLEKALTYYKHGLQVETRFRNKSGMAYCYLNMALVHQRMQNPGVAFDYLQRAKLLAIDSQSNPILKEIYFQLSNYYEARGDLKKANENLKLYSAIVEDLYQKQTAKDLEELDVSYSLIATEEAYERSRVQTLQNRVKDTNIEAFFIIAVMAVMILIALVFILVQIRKERKTFR